MKTLIGILGTILVAASLFAQTYTTGEISGVVTDSTGAVLPHATVTALNKDNGTQRSTQTGTGGLYRCALLPPGIYMVTVTAPSFQTFTRDEIRVEIGHSVHLDFQMKIGSVATKVEVSGTASVLEPSNPNVTTTYEARQLEDIPNPGMDLSHVATVAPGAIMNVVSSNTYSAGNVEFNGLPSVANDFTIDGLDANDSWENLNRTGASGLQLGLSSIQEVSINTTSYGADLGRYGASQINYITKSGANKFHGSAWELWNGSSMNANNYFLNASGAAKPFSNVNQFGGSLSGPIIKNKLLFFGDVEGIRIVVPSVLTTTLPTPAYQTYVLQQLQVGGNDPVLGMNLPPQPGEVGYYNEIFSLVGDTSRGVPLSVAGCPFDVGGGPPAITGAGDGCANQRHFSLSPPTSETLYTFKLNYAITANDSTWYRMQWDDGSVVTPDPVNSLFNTGANYPQRSVVAGWTHTFGPQLINEFTPGFSYWSRLHALVKLQQAIQAVPIGLTNPPFNWIGPGQTQYGNAARVLQLNDNLSWTQGRNGFKFGTNFRRSLFSSYETIGYAAQIPFVYGCSLYEFTYGAACSTFSAFPTYGIDHLSNVSWDNYAMDTIKVSNKLSFTIGMRIAWNSNPVSREAVISRLSNSWETISHDPNQPLNQVIVPNQKHLFADTYPFTWQPRAALAYAATPKTIFRAGGGLFANPLLGFMPTYMDENAPSDVFVSAGVFGTAGGIAMIPGVPNSAIDAAKAANSAFQAGFSSGVVSCAATNAPANCIPAIGFTILDSNKQKFPKIMQWSAGVEREVGKDWGLKMNYVGSRNTNGFYSDSPNGYQFFCQGCFVNYPYAQPEDARFGNIFPFKTGTSGGYHGLQLSTLKRLSHGVAFQANYTYSHCTDEITNGGVIIFNYNENFGNYNGRLNRLRSNCDYDFRHSLNGSYLYELPFRSAKSWLNQVVGGWEVSGTVYARDGLPFSVFSASAGGFVNAYPPLFANVVPGQSPYHTASIAGVTTPGTIQWLNPGAFQSVIDPTTGGCFPSNSPQNCQDGNSGRNNYRTPSFVWTDFSVSKRFKLTEALKLRFDVQMFNTLNHPNFGLPNGSYGAGNANAGIPSNPATLAGLGTISNTVGPSTGLLGGGIGGDSSVRMIGLRLGLEF